MFAFIKPRLLIVVHIFIIVQCVSGVRISSSYDLQKPYLGAAPRRQARVEVRCLS